MAAALSTLPCLREVHIGGHGAYCSLVNASLQKVAENTSLRGIFCDDAISPFYVKESKQLFSGRAVDLMVLNNANYS